MAKFPKKWVLGISLTLLLVPAVALYLSERKILLGGFENTSPFGFSYLYQLLKESHLDVRLWKHPLTDVQYLKPNVIISLSPRYLSTEDILEKGSLQVRHWVQKGGIFILGVNLISLDSSSEDLSGAYYLSYLSDLLPYPRVTYPELRFIDIFRPARLTPLKPLTNDSMTIFTDELLSFRWRLPESARPFLFTRDGNPVAVSIPYGSGQFVTLITSAWLENRFLADSSFDNAEFFKKWIENLTDSGNLTVYLDEFHHLPVQGENDPQTETLTRVYRWFWGYALFLFIAGLYRWSRRTAPPYPLLDERPPGLAFIYQVAGSMKRFRMVSAAREALLSYARYYFRKHRARLNRDSRLQQQVKRLLDRGQELNLIEISQILTNLISAIEPAHPSEASEKEARNV